MAIASLQWEGNVPDGNGTMQLSGDSLYCLNGALTSIKRILTSSMELFTEWNLPGAGSTSVQSVLWDLVHAEIYYVKNNGGVYTLYRVNLTTGLAEASTVLASAADFPTYAIRGGLVADDDFVYYSYSNSGAHRGVARRDRNTLALTHSALDNADLKPVLGMSSNYIFVGNVQSLYRLNKADLTTDGSQAYALAVGSIIWSGTVQAGFAWFLSAGLGPGYANARMSKVDITNLASITTYVAGYSSSYAFESLGIVLSSTVRSYDDFSLLYSFVPPVFDYAGYSWMDANGFYMQGISPVRIDKFSPINFALLDTWYAMPLFAGDFNHGLATIGNFSFGSWGSSSSYLYKKFNKNTLSAVLTLDVNPYQHSATSTIPFYKFFAIGQLLYAFKTLTGESVKIVQMDQDTLLPIGPEHEILALPRSILSFPVTYDSAFIYVVEEVDGTGTTPFSVIKLSRIDFSIKGVWTAPGVEENPYYCNLVSRGGFLYCDSYIPGAFPKIYKIDKATMTTAFVYQTATGFDDSVYGFDVSQDGTQLAIIQNYYDVYAFPSIYFLQTVDMTLVHTELYNAPADWTGVYLYGCKYSNDKLFVWADELGLVQIDPVTYLEEDRGDVATIGLFNDVLRTWDYRSLVLAGHNNNRPAIGSFGVTFVPGPDDPVLPTVQTNAAVVS